MRHLLRIATMLIVVLALIGCKPDENTESFWKCSKCEAVLRCDPVPNGYVSKKWHNCESPYPVCSRSTEKEYNKYAKSRIAYEDDEVIFFLPNSGNVAEEYEKKQQLEILGRSVSKHTFKKGYK